MLAGQANGNAVGVAAAAELEEDVDVVAGEDEEVADMSILIELLEDERVGTSAEDEPDDVVVVVVVVVSLALSA